MYIFSKYGFYSVVQNNYPGEEGDIQIRGRLLGDMIILKAAAELGNRAIRFAVGKDYPYRIIVTTEEFEKVMKILSESVDYKQFKLQISRQADSDSMNDVRLAVYNTVYSAAASMQRAASLSGMASLITP